jgi:hypothetical protein
MMSQRKRIARAAQLQSQLTRYLNVGVHPEMRQSTRAEHAMEKSATVVDHYDKIIQVGP